MILTNLSGLTYCLAKRRESITQEIFARMNRYNFAEMMTSHVIISGMDIFQAEFFSVLFAIRFFLACTKKNGTDCSPMPFRVHKFTLFCLLNLFGA